MEDILKNMQTKHDFLICIDSDGCVFDNMELKHKECFCPATVNVWNLQSVSRYAREAAEYVNLYSRSRGTNRFPALVQTLELLAARPEAQQRGYVCPDLQPLKDWIAQAPALNQRALEAYCAALPERIPILEQTIAWSSEVDANIAHIVRGVAPFPGVHETLAALGRFADIVIVSATPHEAIVREWGAQNLLTHVTEVAGQELGSKKDCIRRAMEGRYAADHVLMVGDAPGDRAAAEDNGVLFYPIIPNHEVDCWAQLPAAAVHLRDGSYAGTCQQACNAAFEQVLLDQPAWL